MKPQPPAFVRRGKSVGAHKGLADTLNWLIRFCTNLRGDGRTAEIVNPLGDHPEIRAFGGAGGMTLVGNVSGSQPVTGDVRVLSATDAAVEVFTDPSTGTATIGVYYV